ncbi:KilA-N domain-containing protein [Moraxella boevrei]|uniref:KilA-N domain-containing protein n=1 Tax=Faucicola boevrei TaxID=346665 RepID=UPI003735AE61
MYSLTILDQKINVIDDLYSLNDLHKSSGGENKHKPSYFMSNQETKEFIQELDNQNINAYCIKQGSKGGTFVYRYAMWISAKFSLMVIRAFDALNTGAIPCLNEAQPTISTEQQFLIRQAIANRCTDNRQHYQTLYTGLQTHFRIPRYQELLARDFDEAIIFIENFVFPRSSNPAQLTAQQWNNLKQLIKSCGMHFRLQVSAELAIWARLRQVTGVKSPQRFSQQHLPILANELRQIFMVSEYYRDTMHATETAYIRQVLKLGDDGIIPTFLDEITSIKTDMEAMKKKHADKCFEKQLSQLLIS